MSELTEEQLAQLAAIPPIPREVYQRALRDNYRAGIEHQLACAVEAGWVAAWHAALGITDDEQPGTSTPT